MPFFGAKPAKRAPEEVVHALHLLLREMIECDDSKDVLPRLSEEVDKTVTQLKEFIVPVAGEAERDAAARDAAVGEVAAGVRGGGGGRGGGGRARARAACVIASARAGASPRCRCTFVHPPPPFARADNEVRGDAQHAHEAHDGRV